MIYEIIHNDGDGTLYEPLNCIKNILDIKLLSHEDNSNTDYPVNRSWGDLFYIANKDVFLKVTVYPERNHPNGYGRNPIIAEYIINITSAKDNTEKEKNIASITSIIEEIMKDSFKKN